MWRQSNAWRRVGATVAAVAWVSPAASLAAYGQPGAPPAPAVAPAAAAGVDPSPPTPAASMAAFNAVDSWVREWRTPMDPSGQAPLAGASVTFRYGGSIVGRGVAFASDSAGGTGILIFAVKRAMDEARERLPIQRDALMEESLKAAAGRMAITVELAGRPVPVSPAAWSELVELVPPGLEGVLVRIGERVEAMFPETMLCTGTDAAAAGRVLVAKLSGDPALSLKEPKELREKHGVEFYRFRVSVLGQAAEGKAPEFFTRGGRVAKLTGLSEEALRIWAEKLAEHLWNQRWEGKEAYGVKSTYDPVRGTNESPFAGPLEQSLVALAMHRYRGVVNAYAHVNGRAGTTSIDGWVLDLLRTLDRVEPGEQPPWEHPAAAAILWYVLDQMRVEPWERAAWTGGTVRDPQLTDLKNRCRTAMDGRLAATEADSASDWVLAWGLKARVRYYGSDQEAIDGFVGRRLVSVDPQRLVATMPWLGWTAGRRAIPALREMRSQFWEHQLRPEALTSDSQDLAGGIVFTGSRQPLPTWHCARPLTYLASMLADDQLTEEREIPTELARLLVSLRFLRQLTAEISEAHMYSDPTRAIGGVRASLFDQRMPPEATAMTLLAVCETINSLEAIKQRQAKAKEEQK